MNNNNNNNNNGGGNDNDEETPAMRRQRIMERRRRRLEHAIEAQDANNKLQCLLVLLIFSGLLGLLTPNSLPLEGLLGLVCIPVIVGLLVIRMTAPNLAELDGDEEGLALVTRPKRTKEQVIEMLVQVPVDAEMVAGMECDICQEEYQVGETLAASRNPDCNHMFHLHCITEWLLENDVCPLCRRNYLVSEKEAASEPESNEEEEQPRENHEENQTPASPISADDDPALETQEINTRESSPSTQEAETDQA